MYRPSPEPAPRLPSPRAKRSNSGRAGLGRDSGTVVAHRDRHRRAIVSCTHFDAAAGLRVRERIGDQVRDGPPQIAPVAGDVRGRIGPYQQFHAARRRNRLQLARNLAHQGVDGRSTRAAAGVHPTRNARPAAAYRRAVWSSSVATMLRSRISTYPCGIGAVDPIFGLSGHVQAERGQRRAKIVRHRVHRDRESPRCVRPARRCGRPAARTAGLRRAPRSRCGRRCAQWCALPPQRPRTACRGRPAAHPAPCRVRRPESPTRPGRRCDRGPRPPTGSAVLRRSRPSSSSARRVSDANSGDEGPSSRATVVASRSATSLPSLRSAGIQRALCASSSAAPRARTAAEHEIVRQ